MDCHFTRKLVKKPKYYQLLLFTSRGPIVFNVRVMAGQETFAGGLRGIPGQCAIVMFDVTSRISYKQVPNWCRDLTRGGRNIPIAIVGNMVDIKDRKVKAKHVTTSVVGTNSMRAYGDISAKKCYNIEAPFLWLARKLLGDNKLYFVKAVAPRPPAAVWDDATTLQYEAEMLQAAMVAPPEDDDDQDDL